METQASDPAPRCSLVPLDAARGRLEALVRERQHGDPLAPVTVVGPSNYANLSLRHALGLLGFANVRFIPMARLAELLGAPGLAAKGMKPLTGALEAATVRAVAAQAQAPLEHLRGHPSLHHALRTTFRDLRRSNATLDEAEQWRPLQREVIRLYRLWREATRTFYDREALAEAAAAVVAQGSVSGLRDLGSVILYLPRTLSPAERDLVLALAGIGQLHAVLGLTGDPQTDAETLALARLLGHGDAVAASPIPPASHIHIAPDAREEVTWVLRQVMQRAEEGVPLRRMAVLYRQTRPYARLVAEQCELAGIPIAGPGVITLAESAAGRTVLGLLKLASGELDRSEVMEWLAACPIKPPEEMRHLFSPSQWDALSRAAGVVRGADQWRDRLERYAQEQERRADDPEVRERRSEAAIERMRAEAAQARALRAFVERLAENIHPPADGSSWQVFADWSLDLLKQYLADHLPEVEQDALERTTDALRELGGVSAVQATATFSEFIGAVEEQLSAPTGHKGRTGQGLFVAPFSAALGMSFDYVFLVGMVEGVVPPRATDDPLFPDAARRRAGVPPRSDRTRDERHAYLAALLAAPHRTLSYPVGDPVEQRKQFPSRWLLEQASLLEGDRVFTTTLERLAHRPWLTRTASREGALRAVAEAAPADLHDRDMHYLLLWRDAGLGLDGHYLTAPGTRLGRALALSRGRKAPHLTAWDGDVSRIATVSRRLRPSGMQTFSPSRLQTWAKCPFQYFLSVVLGIGALETPEETDVITPLDKGSLVHRILETFMLEVMQHGAPAPGEPWSEEHRGRLRAIAEEAFADVEARGLTGRQLLWDIERESILDDLDQFLKEDNQLRRELRATPWRVELPFGEDGDGPVVAGPGGAPVALRGVVDRIDRTEDGGYLVLDYKTGGSTFYKGLEQDPVDKGKVLQLPVYGLAVRQALGLEQAVPVRSAFWFVTTKGGFTKVPARPVELEPSLPRFREVVDVIASGIGDGYFPANPGPDNGNCKVCDFDPVCLSRRGMTWERKQRDPRLAAYVSLSGDGQVTA